MDGSVVAMPEYRALVAYVIRRDATGGETRSTRNTPYIVCIDSETSFGSVAEGCWHAATTRSADKPIERFIV
jgi:hypothetical protein